MISPDCPSTTIHGTRNAYTHHRCRCPEARWASSKSRVRYEMKRAAAGGPLKVDSLPTVRRLRALSAGDWPMQEIVDRVGSGNRASVNSWARGEHPYIWRATAAKIEAIYADLEFRPGPSYRSGARARAKGWQSAEFWLDYDIDAPGLVPVLLDPEPDWTAVARVLDGLLSWRDAGRLERRHAVAELFRQGLGIRRIGMHLDGRTDVLTDSAQRLAERDLSWCFEHGLLERRAS